MELNESIDKLKNINDQKAADVLDNQRHADNQAMALQTQEVVAQSFKLLIEYLDNRVSKTSIVNQLQSIGTPDALKVAEAVNSLHSTLKTHKNTDLTEITKVMQGVLDEAKKIPKELPKEKEQKFVDYSKQFTGLVDAVKAVEKVVKAQELIVHPPVVNVPKAQVNVTPPDLKPLQGNIRDVVAAVNKIVIPQYKTDNKEVEKLLKASNKFLKDILEKPVGGGGGGGGRATPYQLSANQPAFVTLGSQGEIPTGPIPLAVQLDNSASPILYIGKAPIGSSTSSAVWQVAKLDTTSGMVKTWANGNANFNNIFDNKSSLNYS